MRKRQSVSSQRRYRISASAEHVLNEAYANAVAQHPSLSTVLVSFKDVDYINSYAILDPQTGRVEHANAGHDLPVRTSRGLVPSSARPECRSVCCLL